MMIFNGRSPTMRHISRTHRVALDWLFDQFGPKKPNQVHRHQNQLADMLTKGNFSRDEWNHLLCLFNISHFSSTDGSKAMAKRLLQDSGEERVTAKSRPMMSLIARAPSTLSSSASETRGRKAVKVRAPGVRKLRKMIERGNPLSTVTCTQHATQGGMMTKLGLLKSGNLMNWWMIEWWNLLFAFNEEQGHSNSSLETTKQNWNCQWEWSSGKDKNDLRWMLQKTTKKFYDMWNVHVCDIGISSIHGKELLGQLSFHHEYKRPPIETNVRHIRKISVGTRWDLWSGNNWLGKSLMEIFVVDRWWKSYQSSTHKSLRLFRFCIVSW